MMVDHRWFSRMGERSRRTIRVTPIRRSDSSLPRFLFGGDHCKAPRSVSAFSLGTRQQDDLTAVVIKRCKRGCGDTARRNTMRWHESPAGGSGSFCFLPIYCRQGTRLGPARLPHYPCPLQCCYIELLVLRRRPALRWLGADYRRHRQGQRVRCYPYALPSYPWTFCEL